MKVIGAKVILVEVNTAVTVDLDVKCAHRLTMSQQGCSSFVEKICVSA